MTRKTFSFLLTTLALVLLVVGLILLTLDSGKLSVTIQGATVVEGTISGYDAIFGNSKFKFNITNFITFMVVLLVVALLAVRLTLKFLNKNEKAIKILGIVAGVLAITCGVMLILVPHFAEKTQAFENQLTLAKIAKNAEVHESIKIGAILTGIVAIGAGIFELLDVFVLKLFYNKKEAQAETK